MTGIFAHLPPSQTLGGAALQQMQQSTMPNPWSTSHHTMNPQSNAAAGPSSIPMTPTQQQQQQDFLPRQIFSSPTDSPYPASTLAAVEATRARFFARHTTSAPPKTRRPPKSHPLSSSSSSSYRQNFLSRCQEAMDRSRAQHRQNQLLSFRRGADAYTPGVFSDEMEIEDDSSPPPSPGLEEEGGEKEEDNELTRRRIIAEYSRLKRIYELKGHLEIGWIDEEQLSWLESESKREEGEEVDEWWAAGDEQLEQLWLESQTQQRGGQSSGDVKMDEGEDDFDDPAFEEALARLPV